MENRYWRSRPEYFGEGAFTNGCCWLPQKFVGRKRPVLFPFKTGCWEREGDSAGGVQGSTAFSATTCRQAQKQRSSRAGSALLQSSCNWRPRWHNSITERETDPLTQSPSWVRVSSCRGGAVGYRSLWPSGTTKWRVAAGAQQSFSGAATRGVRGKQGCLQKVWGHGVLRRRSGQCQ